MRLKIYLSLIVLLSSLQVGAFELLGKDEGPEYLKNNFIGEEYSLLNKKYRNVGRDDSCADYMIKECKREDKCKCQAITLASSMYYNDNIYTGTKQGKIFYYTRIIDYGRNDFEKVYPTVESFFGKTEPTEIYQNDDYGKWRGFKAYWKFNGGFGVATIFCPLKSVAGKSEVSSPFRECLMKNTQVGFTKKATSPNGKLVKLNY